jgi:APA family basic amino acid/polyamine antiporter
LLPRVFASEHTRYRNPHDTTNITALLVAADAGFVDINEAVELTNIGTLFAFILVGIGVIVLRAREPNRPRPFRCPWVPWVPLLGVASCAYLMAQLPWLTWVRFILWLFIGLVVYFLYGAQESDLCRESESKRSRQLMQARLWMGSVLLAFAGLLFFSGLSRHGALSHKIGSALAIPFKDEELHLSLIATGLVMLLLGLIFVWKARNR